MLVLDGDADGSVPALRLDAVSPILAGHRQHVAQREAVGEEGDAAQFVVLLVVGPRPHLLVVAGHAVARQVQPDDVVAAIASNRAVMRDDLGLIGHCDSMAHSLHDRPHIGYLFH